MTPALRRWVGPITIAVYAAIGGMFIANDWRIIGAVIVGLAVFRAIFWLRSLRAGRDDD